MKAFYEKNNYLIDHDVNKTFEDVLWMTDAEFRQWCIDLRYIVVYTWDILGIPPRVGYNEDEIIDQFKQMESYPVHEFLVKDEVTGAKDVIRNTSTLGNAVNQWFPTMMKVPINYTDDAENGKSIYDFFARDDLLERFTTYARRHFKRDSFYAYSNPLQVGDTRYGTDLPVAKDAIDWLNAFFGEGYWARQMYSFWFAPVDADKEYTGYNEALQGIKYLTITKDEILNRQINAKYTTNVDDKHNLYQIRVFKLGQKLFPVGLKAWRISFCQYAVNYPPLTAKLIYEMYLKPGKNIVWDPSAGWGGRILGCLSVKDNSEITYLANDHNYEHDLGMVGSKYHDIEKFYKANVDKGGLFPTPHNTLNFWCLGSEDMQYDEEFQAYKEKVDLVFTSPPYFAKEAYSDDDDQSYKKFPGYEEWKKGFLYETLKTAYEWLKPHGYLVWNISDVQFGKEVIPLVQDSMDICKEVGFNYVKTWKMALAQMPGGNRLDLETGKPKTRYSCKVNGIWLKYEPILVFQK